MLKKLAAAILLVSFLSTAAQAAPEGYRKLPKGANIYLYGDRDFQVEYRYDIEDKYRDKFRSYIDNYNKYLSGDEYDVYLYFVNNSRSIDFDADMSHADDMYETVRSRLTCADHAACLEIDSFDTYMEYFYQTDHHWKYKGSQAGYEDIVRLLFGPDEAPFKPVEEVTFDVIHNGSYNYRSKYPNSKEKFTVYRYDLPAFRATVNGKKKLFDRQDQYFAGKFTKGACEPHYDLFYGGDWGEIVFETDREDRENLLVLTNSYGSPMRRLLCQHFHRTYFVDLRFYLSHARKDFKLRPYIEEHEIDKILMLGDISYFLRGEKLQ